MKTNRLGSLAGSSGLIIALTIGPLAAQHDHATGASDQAEFQEAASGELAVEVGKTGEVKLDRKTKVGDLTLKPGRYSLKHRVEGSEHFVHFTEIAKGRTRSNVAVGHPGEVKCQVEALQTKVVRTTVYIVRRHAIETESDRITRIEIEGENVAHLF